MENKISKESVQAFFDSLPWREMLDYVKKVQKETQEKLKSGDPLTLQKKTDGTLKTIADENLQKMIVDSFNKSPLRDICGIYGEEETGNVKKTGVWTFIFDPLDGSSEAIKNGGSRWGIMAGFTDEKGLLHYAYNIVSTGEVFRTGMVASPAGKPGLNTKEKPVIDFYDYGSDQDELFREELKGIGIRNFDLTSYPAAVWAGWELFQDRLSALVWVAGENEKKTYPDYDLIFLAPLIDKGFKVRLGKLDTGENVIMVVAPTEEDADMLYQIAQRIVMKKNPVSINEIKNKLII